MAILILELAVGQSCNLSIPYVAKMNVSDKLPVRVLQAGSRRCSR